MCHWWHKYNPAVPSVTSSVQESWKELQCEQKVAKMVHLCNTFHSMNVLQYAQCTDPCISLYFNVFYSCLCHFFSSRCMLVLKFAIYHRAASLWIIHQALYKHFQHTNCISNSATLRNNCNCISISAILHNNCILLLSDLCACVHVKKKWHRKGSHSSSVSGSNHLVRLHTCKKKSNGLVHCSGENAAVLCKTHRDSHANLN